MSEDKLPKYWLRDTVADFLKKRPNQEFSTPSIARWIIDEHLDLCMLKKGFSNIKTDKERITQIAGEIGVAYTRNLAEYEKKRIKAVIENGTRYFHYAETEDAELIKSNEKIDNKTAEKVQKKDDEKELEKDLYEPLCKFLYLEFGVRCKYIDEKTSSNKQEKGSNEWLHPDIVGIEIPKWEDNISSCSARYTGSEHNLWSFEVKLDVSKADIRKKFFQAVANSSWANFGYLVIGDIKASQKSLVMKELRMLSALHGIGCIKVNKNSPIESDILIPASKRVDVDWYSVNRLAVENSDFLKYIQAVESISKNERIRQEDWDCDEKWDKE